MVVGPSTAIITFERMRKEPRTDGRLTCPGARVNIQTRGFVGVETFISTRLRVTPAAGQARNRQSQEASHPDGEAKAKNLFINCYVLSCTHETHQLEPRMRRNAIFESKARELLICMTFFNVHRLCTVPHVSPPATQPLRMKPRYLKCNLVIPDQVTIIRSRRSTVCRVGGNRSDTNVLLRDESKETTVSHSY